MTPPSRLTAAPIRGVSCDDLGVSALPIGHLTGPPEVRILRLFALLSRIARRALLPNPSPENAERQAVEFGVEIGEHRGVVRVPQRVFQRLLPERPTPEKCVESYYLQRMRFESIAERKLRRRHLTEDGNVEISGRDLRKSATRDLQSLRAKEGE